jgi:uncharacterized membrane protein
VTPSAALAYLLPPLTGLVAYFSSESERVRWHGLQSILLGSAWPVALFAGALLSPAVTQIVAVIGAIAWIALLVGAGLGRDPALPGVGGPLRELARDSPRR